MYYLFIILIMYSSWISTMGHNISEVTWIHALEAAEAENNIKTAESEFIYEEVGRYVLKMSKLTHDNNPQSLKDTFKLLNEFFDNRNIKDYADAAQFGRNNIVIDNPEEFNQKLGELFKSNTQDICPDHAKKYQAIIFNTSGIDVFMERLAFLSRLVKTHSIQAEEIIALVGTHAHRKDLMNAQYLYFLPWLFRSDFDLNTFDSNTTRRMIERHLEKKDWIHRNGMEAAWQLIKCDYVMAQLSNKFRYFSGDSETPLRTEQLLEQLIAKGLKKPINQEAPIAFICNAQGAAKTSEMVKKYFPNHNDSVDILIAKPVADEIEEALFNDTPQQRAMTKLFHFYRILETLIKK